MMENDIKPFKWDSTKDQRDELEILYGYIYGLIIENFQLSFIERMALRAILKLVLRRLK